jgi:hypothetical protein
MVALDADCASEWASWVAVICNVVDSAREVVFRLPTEHSSRSRIDVNAINVLEHGPSLRLEDGFECGSFLSQHGTRFASQQSQVLLLKRAGGTDDELGETDLPRTRHSGCVCADHIVNIHAPIQQLNDF